MQNHTNDSQHESVHLNDIQAAETPTLIENEDSNPGEILPKPKKNKQRRMIIILFSALILIVTVVAVIFLFLSGEDNTTKTTRGLR